MNSQPSSFSSRSMKACGGGAPATVKRGRTVMSYSSLASNSRDPGQHRRGHAGEGAVLVLDHPVDVVCLRRAQHDVLAAHRRDRVHAAPAVRVEHRQRPHFGVVLTDTQVGDEVVGVDVGVAVGDHHALGAGRSAGGVVDREQVGLGQTRIGRLLGRVTADPVFVVRPARIDRCVFERDRDVVLDRVHVGPNVVDQVRELGIDQDHLGA